MRELQQELEERGQASGVAREAATAAASVLRQLALRLPEEREAEQEKRNDSGQRDHARLFAMSLRLLCRLQPTLTWTLQICSLSAPPPLLRCLRVAVQFLLLEFNLSHRIDAVWLACREESAEVIMK